jgi:hypothetical protein
MFTNEWINLITIFAVTVIITYDILRRWFILNRKTPQAVIDFPIYQSHEEELNSLKKEIEPFFLDVLDGQKSELSLTVKQLNCISTRGITPIKGEKGLFPIYYEINGNKLIEKELSYPDIHSSTGYEITIWATSFAGTMCFSELISINGFPSSSDNSETRLLPFEKSRLFIYLCNFDGKRMEQLAKSLTIVEIIDDKLVLRI